MSQIVSKRKGKIATLQEALAHINDGSTIMYGGFGGIGNPPSLIQGILDKGVGDLTLIGNDTAFPEVGIGKLVTAGRVKKLIASHIGSNPNAGKLMTDGQMEVEFSPQGTLAERIRAGGVGLGGVLVDVGIGTIAEEGKEKVMVNGREYLIESALTAEVSIVHAKRADTMGNLVFDQSGRNFNPLIAMAGTFTIAEANEIVPAGSLDPEVYYYTWNFCRYDYTESGSELEMGLGVDIRNRIAKRAAQEVHDGMTVNLGIGIPTLVANHIAQDIDVLFHAENGILGTGSSPEAGKEDPFLCNAGGFPVTLVKGASFFDSTIAFGMIRRGYLDVTILGALEVSEKGDLANWIVPGKRVPGMGGAMELAQKSKKVIVLMNHVSKNGESKILKECSLPLTARKSVDLIITDMAVIEVTDEGLVLRETMAPFTVEQVVAHTAAPLKIPSVVTRID